MDDPEAVHVHHTRYTVYLKQRLWGEEKIVIESVGGSVKDSELLIRGADGKVYGFNFSDVRRFVIEFLDA